MFYVVQKKSKKVLFFHEPFDISSHYGIWPKKCWHNYNDLIMIFQSQKSAFLYVVEITFTTMISAAFSQPQRHFGPSTIKYKNAWVGLI